MRRCRRVASGERSINVDVFIVGITGGIGGLLAEELPSRGDTVHGLARRDDQQADLAARGVNARVGDLADMTVEQLAAAFADVDAIVFCAGSNGGSREVTTIREPAPCLSGRRSSMGRSLAKTSPLPSLNCSTSPGSVGRSSNSTRGRHPSRRRSVRTSVPELRIGAGLRQPD
ncbi:NAD(P)H-binding protein [Streptomyces scopuliridis]|uniref:NAD(P)H-binding protein n=1 Tax=Streptomyces scopuliridis TaxID=452529 RepID=UPI0036754C4F